MPELAPGSRYGSFQIIARLGRGLTGSVYRATAIKLPGQPEVALKLLESRDESVRSYFFNEMGLLRRAREQGRPQPHLVEYIASITTQEPYALATRYYTGGKELSELIDAGLIPPKRALQVVEQIAGALDYLHYGHPDAPVVHRDVKPANILVNEQGDALLIDLSAATHQHFRLEKERGLGTPQYMPPEQYEGQEQPQTDQFALALVAYQMLTGKALLRPKPDPESRQLAELRDTGYARVRATMRRYPATAEVIIRGIAYHWQTRYASCIEFAYDLRRALVQDQAPLATEPEAAAGNRMTWAHIGMVAVAALAIVLLAALLRGGQPAPAVSSPTAPTVTLSVPTPQPGISFVRPPEQSSTLAPTTELLSAPTALPAGGATAVIHPARQGCALRTIPSTDGAVIRYHSDTRLVPPEVALEVLKREGQWYHVRLPDGREGWCPSYQLSGVARFSPEGSSHRAVSGTMHFATVLMPMSLSNALDGVQAEQL